MYFFIFSLYLYCTQALPAHAVPVPLLWPPPHEDDAVEVACLCWPRRSNTPGDHDLISCFIIIPNDLLFFLIQPKIC
jgi:hypothetical protein